MAVKRKQTPEERRAKQRAYYERNQERLRAQQRAYEQGVAAGTIQVGQGKRGRKAKVVDPVERQIWREDYQHEYYLVHKLAPRLIGRLQQMDPALPPAAVRSTPEFLRLVEIGSAVIPLVVAEIDAGRESPWCKWLIRELRQWKMRTD